MNAALPVTRGEKLIKLFSMLYGAKFTDQWKSIDPENLSRAWSEELAGFTSAELNHGFGQCRSKPWPPTLPEFMTLCRPPVDYEASYHHAITQMHNRRNGAVERWNSRAVYWAAAALGGDMSQPYASLKGRWKATLDEFMADEPLPEIPAAALALPPPGKQTASPEAVKTVTATLKDMTGKPKNSMQHWRDIRDKHRAGQRFPEIALKYTREALGSMGEQFDKMAEE